MELLFLVVGILLLIKFHKSNQKVETSLGLATLWLANSLFLALCIALFSPTPVSVGYSWEVVDPELRGVLKGAFFVFYSVSLGIPAFVIGLLYGRYIKFNLNHRKKKLQRELDRLGAHDEIKRLEKQLEAKNKDRTERVRKKSFSIVGAGPEQDVGINEKEWVSASEENSSVLKRLWRSSGYVFLALMLLFLMLDVLIRS